MRKAIQAVPQRIKYIAASLYASIAIWCETLGLPEQQFEVAKQGFELYPLDFRSQTMYLKALERRGDLDTIVTTIQFLNNQIEPGADYTWLARSFIWGFDAYDEIGKAIRKRGQPTWVLNVMESAVQKADQNDRNIAKVELPFQMAQFSYRWYDNSDEQTIKLAEVFLERLGRQAAQIQGTFSSEQNWARNKLAQLYFDQAVASHESGGVAYAYVEKLKTLAVSVETSFADDYDGFDFYLDDYPSLLWGRWLREYQQADEQVWRKCFKSRLLYQMNCLDDHNPANDTIGIVSLAKSLFHVGDRQNAAAILAILFNPLVDAQASVEERLSEKTDEVQETEDDLPGNQNRKHQVNMAFEQAPEVNQTENASAKGDPTVGTTSAQDIRALLPLNVPGGGKMVRCDNCRRQSPVVTEMYCCEVCHNVDWCGDCLPMLKDHSIAPGLEEHKCNPHHAFYQMWPIAEETKELAAEYLYGAAHLKREWLERLRTEWLGAI